MKISRNLNLIVPVETELGTAYVHSAPISKEVYREHFLILAKTFAAIFTEGLGIVAGPRVAYLFLEKIAKSNDAWDGSNGVHNTLVNEIIRLSSLVYPVEGKGWDTKPLDVALEREIVDMDDVIGELVFFTCVSSVNKPNQAKEVMDQVNGVWGSQTTSLSLMDWTASLQTLKPAANTGETVNTSSQKFSTSPPESDSPNSGQIAE
ncbi:hypothetical protein BL250_16635 [Erwinia sp. OLTSP20]|uniref:hypothetical protein n=1 Tax=unclassified Erwinia TaxID=2622719 RepID=UPI000C18322B|nr:MULTISPECIES: hypothetical protein [unclassified Erwinia]PIJ48962.1 hypothetical protein BV501_14710 [Erwinia sp. OAMSP11]PIJ74616.1 hypothetical protein BK416_03915 [Erwinia sp. OLSSP12]PIJ79647.1 hypothetical protein BLD47_13335 [Erwinia sp. OLCASP19]PIJ80432.1 hypothetical protein BLD46_15180 [Erwinia sp. OLMTSP26]PIJ82547.1 hypothetical protein BLD49_15075 [Erwinia sp. OLMDSP33]